MYARVATLSTNMLFSKEQLGRGRAWGNRQKPKIFRNRGDPQAAGFSAELR